PGPTPPPGDLLATAYPWPAPGTGWLRAMMLVTLDGAFAGPDGHSRSISSPADRDVLAETRRLADAVLIGAGTLRAERYSPMRARPEAVDERRALGLADAPVLAVVSASLDLPWDLPMFAGESALPPLVVTTRAADAARLARAREVADVEVLGSADLDPRALVAALHARGLHRVVCEGGPTLLARLVAAGVVDEADVTLAPLYVGGGQIGTGAPFPAPVGFDVAHVLEDGGFLFTRMLLRGDADAAGA
ncbi:dihydrofolate reductase family protein, partial [Kineosporia sp. R_H_3]|uniref:dihydrofolate reductase family protein n=1 Tax=Kineosporia sp. R_H_3 TaxID=1961848 RepID=UPI000B4AF6D7